MLLLMLSLLSSFSAVSHGKNRKMVKQQNGKCILVAKHIQSRGQEILYTSQIFIITAVYNVAIYADHSKTLHNYLVKKFWSTMMLVHTSLVIYKGKENRETVFLLPAMWACKRCK